MRRAQVDTTETRECGKCHRSDLTLYRHHKGFDSLVGQYNRGIGYSYHQYIDCVDLCFDHHCEIHYIYQPYVDKWVNRTPKGAALFRKALIKVCDRWLVGKIKSPKVPERFITQFFGSLEKWKARERLEKSGTG